MEPVTIGIVSLLVLFVMLVLAIPIGIAMGLAGLGGMAAIIGFGPALSLFGTTVYETAVTYDLSIVPLFVLMGAVATRSGLSKELYSAFNAWFGAMRGGLALAT
ncbi:MAG: TRAP transporter permease, partial [Beijerinckiaceae bacterium]|nr:TRAP transporter permease [Beijerinckiaceae bacterium]